MKKKFFVFVILSMTFASVANAFAFNPQPEPPGDRIKLVNPIVVVSPNSQSKLLKPIAVEVTR